MNYWQRLSLNRKIVAIIVLTTFTATVTIVPAIFLTIRKGMIRQQQTYLTGIKNLVDGLLRDNHRAVRNYAVLFSKDRAVKDNLFYHTELAGERVHPLRAIKHLVEAFEVEFIELTDRKGVVVANTSEPSLYDTDRSQDPFIRDALSGRVTTGVKRLDKGFLLTASSPIYYDQEQLIGTITTGIYMDDAFAQRIRSLTGVELAVLDGKGRVIAASLPGLKSIGKLMPDSGFMSLSGKKYLLIRMPVQKSGTPGRGELLIMAEDRLPGIIRSVHLTVTAILLFISILSITATVFIIRRVLAPVQELEKGAELIGKGDFRHRIDVKAGDEIGNLARVFNNMARNLEAMKEMEERLQHSERLASIGRFTSGIAHEMNNPIANIIGLLKLVKNEISDDAVKEDLEIAIREASRCGSIVRDLLLYCRQSPPRKESLRINPLIEDVLKTINQSLDGREIEIRKSLDAGLPQILADPLQIEQVLRNLILNAIQSIEESGEVKVETGSENGYIIITVSDTGCGIDRKDLDRIFYPFYTTKGTGEGTGLGLTVSYGIIQAHGGDIEVSSGKGRGSIFRVRLPIKPSGERLV